MLDKFYIVSVDGTCHMKVEVDAQPIQEYLLEREAEENRKKMKERDDLKDAMMATQLQQTALEEKERLIDKSKGHHVLKSPHPSGLSAHRGFYGCKHFSQANAFIEKNGGAPVDWQIV